MSTKELKNKLKKKIEELNEDHLLEELLNIIDLESNNSEVFIIPDEHKKQLEISTKQMESCQFKSHEDVIRDMQDDFRS